MFPLLVQTFRPAHTCHSRKFFSFSFLVNTFLDYYVNKWKKNENLESESVKKKKDMTFSFYFFCYLESNMLHNDLDTRGFTIIVGRKAHHSSFDDD